MRSNNRYTIYDVMDARGEFRKNPANADAEGAEGSTYEGPVEFPKLLYHPTGEERVIKRGEVLLDRDGFPRLRDGKEIVVGEIREIIWRKVETAEEEEKLLGEGWHPHPALAIAAGGGEAPPISSADRIKKLETELARAQKELATAQAPLGRRQPAPAGE